MLVLRLSKLRVDDSKGQVKQKESTYDHNEHEQNPNVGGERYLNISLDLTPSLQGNELEDSQEGILYVVEASNAIVWIVEAFRAVVASWTVSLLVSVTELLIGMDLASLRVEASVLKNSTEHLGATDWEDDEEEQHDKDCIFKHRDSREYGHDQHFQSFNTWHCL